MKYLFISMAGLLMLSCNKGKFKHDASGTFEATETTISANASGRVEQFNITEGDVLTTGMYLGYIDTTQLHLKKLQLMVTMKSVLSKRPDVSLQVASIREQIGLTETEKARIENMFKDGAATQKQVDDINSQLNVLRKNLQAQLNTLSTSDRSIVDESEIYAVQIKQTEDEIEKSRIVNPVNGVVLAKYIQEKEMVGSGSSLYKIADTKHLFLRAYIISGLLNTVSIGQDVTVYIYLKENDYREYPGKVTWISDKAEFTPKTIQTKDERQNLVYAVKIAVGNSDGLIKIGMYGDVDFKQQQQ